MARLASVSRAQGTIDLFLKTRYSPCKTIPAPESEKAARAAKVRWTRNDVDEFLTLSFQGGVTLAEAVAQARDRFPDQKPRRASRTSVMPRDVDGYLERFVLEVLKVVATPHVVDVLLSAETAEGPLGSRTRP
jgi:hypothetical protein